MYPLTYSTNKHVSITLLKTLNIITTSELITKEKINAKIADKKILIAQTDTTHVPYTRATNDYSETLIILA